MPQQPPQTVIMPVEFHPGRPQTVRLASPATDFAKLRPEFWSSPTEITLPADQFRYDKIVPDVAIAICGLTEPQPLPEDQAPSDRGGAIVVMMESPHEKEYGP